VVVPMVPTSTPTPEVVKLPVTGTGGGGGTEWGLIAGLLAILTGSGFLVTAIRLKQ
jgi:hypothetical protein